jgi:hypothetical protein
LTVNENFWVRVMLRYYRVNFILMTQLKAFSDVGEFQNWRTNTSLVPEPQKLGGTGPLLSPWWLPLWTQELSLYTRLCKGYRSFAKKAACATNHFATRVKQKSARKIKILSTCGIMQYLNPKNVRNMRVKFEFVSRHRFYIFVE